MNFHLPLNPTRHVTVISAYAPTFTSSDEAKDAFYEELNALMKDVPPSDKLILLWDFNARVNTDCNNWKGGLVPHGTGKLNSNSLMLLSFCAENDLTITNTLFRQADKYKTTYNMDAPQIETVASVAAETSVTLEQCGGQSVGLTTASSGPSCRCTSLQNLARLQNPAGQLLTLQNRSSFTQSHVWGPRRQADCPRTTVWTPTSTVGTVQGWWLSRPSWPLGQRKKSIKTGSMITTSASKNSWMTRRKASSSGRMASPPLQSVTASSTSKGRPGQYIAECRTSGGRIRLTKSKPTLPQRTQKCFQAPSRKSMALPSHAPRRSCQLMAQPCLRRRAESTQGGGNTSVSCSTDPPLWTPLCSTRSHRSPWSPALTSPIR